MVNLDPAHGDTDQIRTAANAVSGYARCLVGDRTTANNQTVIATDGTWTGQAAAAYTATMDGLSSTSVGIVDAWDRVAAALNDYAARLEDLQADAAIAVSAYHRSLAAVSRARSDLDRAEKRSGGAAYGLQGTLTSAQRQLDQTERELDDLQTRRTALDAEIAQRLTEALGPGAAAWSTVAVGPDGRRVNDHTLVDNVLDLLTDGQVTAADLDLLHQLLLQYGADPAICDQLYSALGAQGLVDLQNAVVTAPNLSDDQARRAADILAGLSTGLAIASQGWSAPQCRAYGSDLIDAISDAECSAIVTVPALLSSSGLNPQIGIGAMTRLDQLRHDDPARFESITTARDPNTLFGDAALASLALGSHQVIDLASSVFGCMSGAPADALDFFTEGQTGLEADRIDYWFYEHDWSLSGFEAPAGMLDAIVNAPELQQGRTSADEGTPWALVTQFAGRAFEALGANPAYTVDTITTTAANQLISALSPYLPETTTRVMDGDASGEESSVLTPDGWILTRTLDVNRGNLARLLGIALTQQDALTAYGTALNNWKTAIIDAINSDTYTGEELVNALKALGAAQALAYSYGAEAANHAEHISDQHKQDLDLAYTFFSFAPSVSSGIKAVDYAAGVAAGNSQSILETLDPDILTPEEITAMSTGTRDQQRTQVANIAGSKLTNSAAEAIDLSGQDSGALGERTPEKIISSAYDDYANAASNRESTATWSIVAPGVDAAKGPTTSRGEMP